MFSNSVSNKTISPPNVVANTTAFRMRCDIVHLSFLLSCKLKLSSVNASLIFTGFFEIVQLFRVLLVFENYKVKVPLLVSSVNNYIEKMNVIQGHECLFRRSLV